VSQRKSKPVRRGRVRDSELEPYVSELLDHARKAVEPGGWTVHVERSHYVSLVFTSPLSPEIIGFSLTRQANPDRDRRRLSNFLKKDSEIARLAKVAPPSGKKRLLGGVRGSAATYGWSDETYEQVVNMLAEVRAITTEEWEWLTAVGPAVFPEHVRDEMSQRRQAGPPA